MGFLWLGPFHNGAMGPIKNSAWTRCWQGSLLCITAPTQGDTIAVLVLRLMF